MHSSLLPSRSHSYLQKSSSSAAMAINITAIGSAHAIRRKIITATTPIHATE